MKLTRTFGAPPVTPESSQEAGSTDFFQTHPARHVEIVNVFDVRCVEAASGVVEERPTQPAEDVGGDAVIGG